MKRESVRGGGEREGPDYFGRKQLVDLRPGGAAIKKECVCVYGAVGGEMFHLGSPHTTITHTTTTTPCR